MVKSCNSFNAFIVTSNKLKTDCWYDEKSETLLIELPIVDKEKAQLIYIEPIVENKS